MGVKRNWNFSKTAFQLLTLLQEIEKMMECLLPILQLKGWVNLTGKEQKVLLRLIKIFHRLMRNLKKVQLTIILKVYWVEEAQYIQKFRAWPRFRY